MDHLCYLCFVFVMLLRLFIVVAAYSVTKSMWEIRYFKCASNIVEIPLTADFENNTRHLPNSLSIAALWSPEEKGLTSWLLSVMFIVILLLSHLIPEYNCLSYFYNLRSGMS